MLNKNLMIVIIDHSGVKMMMHLMKKLFKFKELKIKISLNTQEKEGKAEALGVPLVY